MTLSLLVSVKILMIGALLLGHHSTCLSHNMAVVETTSGTLRSKWCFPKRTSAKVAFEQTRMAPKVGPLRVGKLKLQSFLRASTFSSFHAKLARFTPCSTSSPSTGSATHKEHIISKQMTSKSTLFALMILRAIGKLTHWALDGTAMCACSSHMLNSQRGSHESFGHPSQQSWHFAVLEDLAAARKSLQEAAQ